MFHVTRANFGRQGSMVPSSGTAATTTSLIVTTNLQPSKESVDVEEKSSLLLDGLNLATIPNPREQKLLAAAVDNIKKLNGIANTLKDQLCAAHEIEQNLAKTEVSEQEQCAKAVKGSFDDALNILIELTTQRDQLSVFADSNKFFAEELRKNSQDSLAKEKEALAAAEIRFIHKVDLVLSGMFY